MPTVQAIRADLDDGGWLKRYRTDDGFGTPDVAFSLCTFWLVEALARLGPRCRRPRRARSRPRHQVAARPAVGGRQAVDR